MKANYSNYSEKDLLSGFRIWWPNRHGVNAGAIRQTIKDYVKELRKRKKMSDTTC